MIDEWLTVRQFSYNTGLAESAIRQRVKRKTIIKHRNDGRSVLIHKSELEFIENHLSPEEFAEKTGYSVDVIYYHMNNGNLSSVKRGRLRFIHKNAKITSMVDRRKKATTLLTPEDYATHNNRSLDSVYYHLRVGNLKSKKIGRRHMISPSAKVRKKAKHVLRES